MNEKLTEVLRGVQRVPSLLLHNPTQNISTLNLQHYTILECEPLHDMKGHLRNIFDVLPSILEKKLALRCKELLDVDLFQKNTKRGADCRLAAIHLLSLLKQLTAPPKVVKLIETMVVISELLYADHKKRSPQTVLQLYNSTYLHHEICKDLFEESTEISHRKLFGSHLHALVVHAPAQYEIMCLCSCNTECEERLFGQAKAIAQSTTNRQPSTIIPNILLRLQAKQRKGGMYDCMCAPSSKISKESQGIKQYTMQNTFIEKAFISKRMASWQAHLQRISQFLLPGEGVWWKNKQSGYEFMDRFEVSSMTGPNLLHFRNANLFDIPKRNTIAWNSLVADRTLLPTPFIRLYDNNGEYCGRYIYNGSTVESSQEVTHQSESQATMQETTNSTSVPTGEISISQPQTTTLEVPCTSHTLATGPKMPSTIQTEIHTSHEENMITELRSEADMNVEEVDRGTLKTKLVIAISKALGSSCDCQSELKKLDHLRTTIKQGKKTAKNIIKHKKLISLFKNKLHHR